MKNLKYGEGDERGFISMRDGTAERGKRRGRVMIEMLNITFRLGERNPK